MYLLALIVGGGMLLLWGRMWLTGHTWQAFSFRLWWLVPVAVVPQLLVFYLPGTRVWVPSIMVPVVLVWSQLVLIAFVWINRDVPGLWLLGAGLAMNLVATLANGGLMPVTAQAAANLTPAEAVRLGARFGLGKSAVLPGDATVLGLLGDRFVLPTWIPYRAAFSVGDVFIVAGALVLSWALSNGKPQQRAMKLAEITSQT